MTWIIFLLGSILFLPGYLYSFERSLEQGRPFQPLRILHNIKILEGRIKRLTFVGFILACLALFAAALGYGDMALISRDFVRLILAVMCVFFVLCYGHVRSELGRIETDIPVSQILRNRSNIVLVGVAKAAKDLSLIALAFVIIFLSNQLTRDGSKWLPL